MLPESPTRTGRCLRSAPLPYLVILAALVLTPLVGPLIRAVKSQPVCTGIDFGCDLSPEDEGWLWQWIYFSELVVLLVLVALLHLGRGRLALVRAWTAICGVTLAVVSVAAYAIHLAQ